MRRPLILLAALCLAVPAGLHATRTDDGRLKDAELVLTEMAGSFDTGIPKSLFNKARCVVIIPGVKKAALGIGGQYGRGYISCRLDQPNSANASAPVVPSRWSPPGGIRVEGGSVGLQIGGSETDVILLVMNQRGVDRLLTNNFKVGADAAVAAGPVGREATAQTDITMRAEMLAWSRSRGVFAGLSLQGSTLRDDSGENKELYGREIDNKEVITGKIAVPKSAESLMKVLSKF
jgi:lipid-binding SYLF domain-containing protein